MEKIEFENRLIDAIKRDDLKSFSFLMPTNSDLNLCFGRFPILSLLYLYSSFKILSKFEKLLMPIHNFKVVDERVEFYKKFKTKAKKTIRYFSGEEIIYPVYMLAVLNERTILKHNFKFLYKNAEIAEKLGKIYKIRYNLNLEPEQDLIKIQSSKITYGQSLLFCVVSFICCLLIAFAGIVIGFVGNKNGFGNDSNPIKINNAESFISAIKYGKRNYVIESDIVIDGSDFVNTDFSGAILGKGHTISISGNINDSMIKNLTGRIENLKIKVLSAEVKITQNWAVIAENSSGIIDNCDIIADFSGDFNSTEEIFAGLLVSKNTGQILNSEVEINATLKNSNQSNAYFGGIVGVNEGTISMCESITGLIEADTVDLAGIACQNYGLIFESENNLVLNQVSDKEWHPNVAGVSIANYGKIENSKNFAELNASSLTDNDTENNYYVFIGGISCENYGEIQSCKNYGQIFSRGKIANAIIGGVVSQNIDDEEKGLVGKVNATLSKSNITAFSEKGYICVGGVVGLNATSVTNSGFIGLIDAESTATESKDVFVSNIDKVSTVFAGGVVGLNQYSEIKNCYADVDYLADGSAIVPNEEDKPQKFYTGIVGNVSIYLYTDGSNSSSSTCFNYIDNNFYIEKDEIQEHAYGVVALGEFYYSTLGRLQFEYVSGIINPIDETILGENSTIFGKCASLQEVPLEVIYE